MKVSTSIIEFGECDNIQIKVKGVWKKSNETDPDFNLKTEISDFDDGDSTDLADNFDHEFPEDSPPVKIVQKLKRRPLKKKSKSKTMLFPCEYCGNKFVGKGNLANHIKRIHLKEKEAKCKICPKAFFSTSALENHMLAVHTRRCEECQEYVVESVPWTEGMTMKTTRQVSCQCGEIVNIFCSFGRKPIYEDDDCDEKTRRKRNNDQTKYACQQCGKLFTSRSHCLRHARKHTQSKNINCQYCSEKFRYEGSLKKHLQNEHRMFPSATCQICKSSFSSIAELKKHHLKNHASRSGDDKFDSAESKLLKVVTNPQASITPTVAQSVAPNFKVLPISTPRKSEAGTSEQEAVENVLDKETYELVQQAMLGDQLFSSDGNTIVVDVFLEDDIEKVQVEMPENSSRTVKVELMDDSDMEYLDGQYEENDETLDSSIANTDDDEDPDFVPEQPKNVAVLMSRRRRPRSQPPIKKRPPSETALRKCNQCDQVLTGISSLNSHIKRVHLKEKKYPCHICGYAFFTSTHREDHLLSVHTRKCMKCSKDVIETEPWTEGMDRTYVRTVTCSCGNDVLIHSKTGRLRAVDENGRRFKRRRCASEIAPVECEHCGITLTGRSSLYAHIRRQHLNVRNFKCSVCSKEFFSSTHLNCHVLSVHTRKCGTCQEFVMETEPWPENMDKSQSRELTCKCGAKLEIFTKRGPKFRNESSAQKKLAKKKSKDPADTRYVCGSCGKIFLKKFNAMSHKCKILKPSTADEDLKNEINKELPTDNILEASEVEETESEFVLDPDGVQYKMDGENLVLTEGSHVVMYEDGDSASNVPTIQIMHGGKLVPAEQTVDEHGNVSLIIKQVE